MTAIHVAVLPGYNPLGPGQPYYPLLYENLTRFGIRHSEGKVLSVDPVWLIKNRRRYSVLHFHWISHYYDSRWIPYLGLRMLWFIANLYLARLFGYRILWTVHEPWPVDASGMRLAILRWTVPLLARMTSALIVHTEWAKKEILPWAGNTPVYTIPHGHFCDFYSVVPPKKEARFKLGIPHEVFLYLFFGTILPYKGVAEAVEAFLEVKEKGSFWIVGEIRDPIYGRRLKRIIQESSAVRLVEGIIPHTELPLYLSACDAVVTPYLSIFTSGVLPLSVSFHKPFIAPNHPGLVEQVPQDMGIFYDPRDPQALKEAFRKIKNLDMVKVQISAEEWKKIMDGLRLQRRQQG